MPVDMDPPRYVGGDDVWRCVFIGCVAIEGDGHFRDVVTGFCFVCIG
jgi:hypothetical protein